METDVASRKVALTRPRSILPRIALALALILLIATSTAAALIARYDPLTHGDFGGTPRISLPNHDIDAVGDDLRTRVITYVQDGTLDVALSVRNRGPWGVTILGVENRDFGLFHVTEVRRGVLNRCCVRDEPFASFALHPGEDRVLTLHGVVSGCRNVEGEGSVSWHEYEIRYRMMGIVRSATIEAFDEIEIHIPEGYHCTEQPVEFVPSARPTPRSTS